jgi:hypothetical protein
VKRIRYAKITLKVVIPVYSHTAEEAREIAKDQLADFVSAFEPADWENACQGPPALSTQKPRHLAGDELVWGDGVPEDHCRVDELIRHLA